jgi:hypothetical protein
MPGVMKGAMMGTNTGGVGGKAILETKIVRTIPADFCMTDSKDAL